jgi:hypothetical protein
MNTAMQIHVGNMTQPRVSRILRKSKRLGTNNRSAVFSKYGRAGNPKKDLRPAYFIYFGKKSFVATSVKVGRFFKMPATSMTSVAAFNACCVIRPSRLYASTGAYMSVIRASATSSGFAASLYLPS